MWIMSEPYDSGSWRLLSKSTDVDSVFALRQRQGFMYTRNTFDPTMQLWMFQLLMALNVAWMVPWESEHGASLLSKDCKVSYTVLVHIGQVRFGLEGTYVSHLADESNRSCLWDLMSTVQVSSTSADTGVHKVLPSRGKPGLPRATGPRMLCRSAEACDSYECVRIVAIIHMASKLLLLPTDWCKQWVILHSFSDNEVFRMFSEIKR